MHNTVFLILAVFLLQNVGSEKGILIDFATNFNFNLFPLFTSVVVIFSYMQKVNSNTVISM